MKGRREIGEIGEWGEVEEEKKYECRTERVEKWRVRKEEQQEKKRKRKESIKIFWPVWTQHNYYYFILFFTFELQCTAIFGRAL